MNIVNVGYRSTHYYVLADDKPRLLVDAGWPGRMAEFQSTSKRMSIELAQIPYILPTHYHMDHAGLAQELKHLGCKLIVMETQVAAIPLMKQHMKPTDHYVEITLNDNVVLTIEDSRAFLAKIGIRGEIISTPGHSDDSVTLVLEDGAAFTGDLTLPMLATDEAAETVRASWQKIREAGGRTIYPGHGQMWTLE